MLYAIAGDPLDVRDVTDDLEHVPLARGFPPARLLRREAAARYAMVSVI